MSYHLRIEEAEKYENNIRHFENLHLISEKYEPIRLEFEQRGFEFYCNGKVCGLTNYDYHFTRTIDYKTEDVERIIELATNCNHREFSSSSPSMILHQISVLTLVELLDGKKSIEEFYRERRNDLLWISSEGESVIVEVTGENFKKRFDKMKSQFNDEVYYCVFNKYVLNPIVNDYDDLIKMSKDNDKAESTYIYDKIIKQSDSLNLSPFYSEKLIKFFLRTPDIHVRAANLAYSDYIKDNFKRDEDRESEFDYQDYVKETCKRLVTKLEERMPELKKEYDFYSVPVQISKDNREDKEDENMPLLDEEAGNLYYEDYNVTESENKLYNLTNTCSVHQKTFEDNQSYAMNKRMRENATKSHLIGLSNRYISLTRVLNAINRLCFRQYGTSIFNYDGKKRRLSKKIKPCFDIHKGKNFEFTMMRLSNCSNERLRIDPDHFKLMNSYNVPKHIIDFYTDSRDIYELRFKRRIAIAATLVYKPNKPFRVNHWHTSELYADCIILGSLFKKDSGILYVSYFYKDTLYKTQKWRLPDVENYIISNERALALTISISNLQSTTNQSKYNMLTMYYRLLNENSWGISKFLKPYRYFSSGIAMGSSRIHNQINKILKVTEPYMLNKLSIRFLILCLKDSPFIINRTPAFSLDFKNIGYECFLMNLCPARTYGSKRHLINIMRDLDSEIELYNSSEDLVKSIFDDFENIISKRRKFKDLRSRYYEHLKIVNNISTLTDGRFTFSPLSLLIVKRDLDNMKLRPELSEVPSINKLSTARGSTSNISFEPMMAMETIHELCNSLNSMSTSRLACKLISRAPVDLTMRMFDKDQVGGDREISILNAGFRVCQSVSESFFRNLGYQTGIDLLADKYKTLNYTKTISEALESDHCRLLTIDQTRWGPNFNTLTFGLLGLMTSSISNEYYLPSLICLISEFKVFEYPVLEPDMSGKHDISFSLPGRVGRSHMGQGIFHYASSFYHSLSLSAMRRHYYNLKCLKPSELVIRNYCTSDDASIISFVPRIIESNESREDIHRSTSDMYSFMEYSVKYFGIKTNESKNIDSQTTIEFNSMYFSKLGIGSNDLKFLYSLIDSSTTGNIYRDSHSPFITFDRAINSGCNLTNSLIISSCVSLIRIRQWKCRGNVVDLPNHELIQSGIDILQPASIEKIDDLKFDTSLNFKRRERLRKQIDSKTQGYLMSKIIAEVSVEMMLKSRVSDKHRSLLTHSQLKNILLAPRSNFRKIWHSAITISKEVFMREIFKSNQFMSLIKSPDQTMSVTMYKKSWTTNSLFTFKILKQRSKSDFDPISLTVSMYDQQKWINNLRDENEIILHLYRKRGRYNLSEEFRNEHKSLSLESMIRKFMNLNDEIQLSSPNVIQMIYNPDRKEIEYTRQIRTWPIMISTHRRVIDLKCIDSKSDIKTNIYYINTAGIQIDYLNYEVHKGSFNTRVPDLALPLPQASLTIRSFSVEDLDISIEVLRAICEKENEFRKKRKDIPYLIMKRRVKDEAIKDSVSQFTADISESTFLKYKYDKIDKDEYVCIRLPESCACLASYYTLKQTFILSALVKMRDVGAVIFKDLDTIINGVEPITSFNHGLIGEIEWLIQNKMTKLQIDGNYYMKKKGVLHDLYEKVFEKEEYYYHPFYFLLGLSGLNYISFSRRGKLIDKFKLKELLDANSLVEEYGEGDNEIFKIPETEVHRMEDSDISFEKDDNEDSSDNNSGLSEIGNFLDNLIENENFDIENYTSTIKELQGEFEPYIPKSDTSGDSSYSDDSNTDESYSSGY